jgi:hypothetical protein
MLVDLVILCIGNLGLPFWPFLCAACAYSEWHWNFCLRRYRLVKGWYNINIHSIVCCLNHVRPNCT